MPQRPRQNRGLCFLSDGSDDMGNVIRPACFIPLQHPFPFHSATFPAFRSLTSISKRNSLTGNGHSTLHSAATSDHPQTNGAIIPCSHHPFGKTPPLLRPIQTHTSPLITHSVFTANNLHRVFALPRSTTLNLLPSSNIPILTDSFLKILCRVR